MGYACPEAERGNRGGDAGMSITAALIKYGGRVGGAAIYYSAKAAAGAVNFNRERLGLQNDERGRLEIFFPDLDLSRVRIVPRASLPANWFGPAGAVEAMAFGETVYSRHEHPPRGFASLLLLIHELVHVRQIHFMGETAFAVAYGEEYLRFGYRAMPLEQEAYDFVRGIPFDYEYYRSACRDAGRPAPASPMEAFAHWLDLGIDEGRRANEAFDPKSYLERYGDLRASLGAENYRAAVLHWIRYGIKENRDGS